MVKPKILERDVEKAVCDFLVADGWRVLKMEQVFSRDKLKSVGEQHMPDRIAIRYSMCSILAPNNSLRRLAEVLWIETKAPGKALRIGQKMWHKAECARGALVLTVSDIDAFRNWYAESGLARRVR